MKAYLAASKRPEGTLVGVWKGRKAVRLWRGLGVHEALCREAERLRQEGFTPVAAQTSVAARKSALLPEGPEDLLGLGLAREALADLLRVEKVLEGAKRALKGGKEGLARSLLEVARYWAETCPGLPEGAALEEERVAVEAV